VIPRFVKASLLNGFATSSTIESNGSHSDSISTSDPLSSQQSLLLEKVDRLANRAERWVWIHAISSVLLLSLSVLATLILLDVWFRWQEPGMRWLCWFVWVAVTVAAAIHWLRRARHFSSLSMDSRRERMGMQIERTLPETRSLIASAIAFASENSQSTSSHASPHESSETANTSTRSSQAGSMALRNQTINQAARILASHDLSRCLDRRRPFRQLLLALLTLAGGLLLILLQPSLCQTALLRLLSPWTQVAWPQVHQLRFVDLPKVIPAGNDLEVRVVDSHGSLPEDIQLALRRSPEATGEPAEIMSMKVNQQEALLVLPGSSLVTEAASSRISLRAFGGDDQNMPWQEIVVATVPQLKSFSLRITPPPYSGQSPTEVTGQSIRVLAGSRVVVQGEWTSPVQSASIDRWASMEPVTTANNSSGNSSSPPSTLADSTTTKDHSSKVNDLRANSDPEQPVVQLLNPANRFAIGTKRASVTFIQGTRSIEGLLIEQSMELSLRWKSMEGLEVTGPKWNFQAIADRPPTINLVTPEDATPVTPGADIQVQAESSDDLGLESIRLQWVFAGGDENEAKSEELWSSSKIETSAKNSSSETFRKQVSLDQLWRIPQLSELKSNPSLIVWLEAIDSAKQVSKSRRVTLRFSTAEETLAELAQRQAAIRPKLEQALQQLRDASLPVTSSMEVLERSGQLQQADRDALQSALRNQKNLRNALVESEASVKQTLESISKQLQANHLDESELAKENNRLADELTRIDREEIKSAIDNLQSASQSANDLARQNEPIPNETNSQKLAQSLQNTADKQASAAKDMQQLIDSLSQSEGLRQAQAELQTLARKQQELQERTEQLQRQMVLDPTAKELGAERTRVEVSQNELAREVERIEQQLRDASEALQENAPQLAENSQKLADDLVQSEVSSKMREATSAVSENRLDRALQQQQEAIEALADSLNQTRDLSQPSLSDLEEALAEAMKSSEQLTEQQQQLADELKKSANSTTNSPENRSEQAKAQQQLRDRTERLQREVESMLGSAATEQLQSAEQEQKQAEESLTNDQPAEAGQAAQQAADALRDATEQLSDTTMELQQEAIADRLQALRPLVERLYREENDITSKAGEQWKQFAENNRPEDNSEIPEAEKTQLDTASRQFAAQQLALRQLLARSTPELAKLPAFQLAADAILADMDQAIAGFERSQFEETALPAAESAQRQLAHLQEALAQSAPNESPEESAANPEEAANEAQQQEGDFGAPLASLKLLRGLQRDILAETEKLHNIRTQNPLNASQQKRLNQLADLQQKLAEQVESLVREAENGNTDNGNTDQP
jgi:hypothetical protein